MLKMSRLLYALTVLCIEYSSAVAGGLASYLTNPLDIAKLRFQVQQAGPVPASASATNIEGNSIIYRGLIHATRDIYQQGGIRGLFRGAGARVLFHTPSTAITMAVYEECKTIWKSF
jgi:solute carrier family 25 thiamine pyrophosphate transporter 19